MTSLAVRVEATRHGRINEWQVYELCKVLDAEGSLLTEELLKHLLPEASDFAIREGLAEYWESEWPSIFARNREESVS